MMFGLCVLSLATALMLVVWWVTRLQMQKRSR